MSDQDEIVITLTEAEWNQVRGFFEDAAAAARSVRQHKKVCRIIWLLAHNANDLTLTWIDQKLEEFA